MGDDSVGLRVARELSTILHSPDLIIEQVSAGGLDILNLIADCDIATIVDAVQTSHGNAGTIYSFDIDEVIAFPHKTHAPIRFCFRNSVGEEVGTKDAKHDSGLCC